MVLHCRNSCHCWSQELFDVGVPLPFQCFWREFEGLSVFSWWVCHFLELRSRKELTLDVTGHRMRRRSLCTILLTMMTHSMKSEAYVHSGRCTGVAVGWMLDWEWSLLYHTVALEWTSSIVVI